MNIFKTLTQKKPKGGDKVRVAIGFDPKPREGIITSVHDDYCWIDATDNNPFLYPTFTASFSYANFTYL